MSIRRCRGFALVITLGLLALLVLAVYSLSALVRVNAQVAETGLAQLQACQNAQLALDLALAELQAKAGDDRVLTGMAGLMDIAPHASASTRHWAGVWRDDGFFIGWLTSGAQDSAAALRPGVSSVVLVGSAAVGAPAANSEHVIAGKLTLRGVAGSPGGAVAYVVLDEGVKTPAFAPAPIGVPPVIFATTSGNAQGRLRDAIAVHGSALPRASLYEQLLLLPSPGAALTPSVIQDNWHHVTLTTRFVSGAQLRTGLVNVNTNSALVWRNLLQTFNTSPAAPAPIPPAALAARGTSLQNTIATFAADGKATRGPFTSVGSVAAFLASVFTSGSPTAAQIYAVLAPQISVRSDTFRIRAYGEVRSSADGVMVAAQAHCEAWVQRTPERAPNGAGRRFAVTSFRWLGPGDI